MSSGWRPDWAEWLVRHRWAFFALYLLLQAFAFNGQWRVGLDSATYRLVGHSLATEGTYAIHGEPQRHVYPGLPLLLAGMERLFGEAAWPGVLVMQASALGVLWLTYHLMRRAAEPWVATLVAVGVGSNQVLVTLSHELLTDMPFLLAVLMSLWGWETLTEPGWGRRLRSAAWLVLGLALGASLRPTFWVVAAALLLVCAGGLLLAAWSRSGKVAGRSWRFYSGCFAAVLLVGLAFIAIDPRTRDASVLAGVYEAEVADSVANLGPRIREAPRILWTMFEDHLVRSFFAERIEGVNVLLAAMLLGGVVLVGRRRPLWGLLVAMLCLALFLTDSMSRYYLMVLPILWLAWIQVSSRLAGRLTCTQQGRSIVLAVLASIVIAFNVGHDVKLVLTQRARPFLAHFSDGTYVPVMAMAEVIRQQVPEGERVIGPYAPIMTWASGRRVLGRRELFTGRERDLAELAKAVEASGAAWAVFPREVYQRKDYELYELGRADLFIPTNADDTEVLSAGTFGDHQWYLARWKIEWDNLVTRPQEP